MAQDLLDLDSLDLDPLPWVTRFMKSQKAQTVAELGYGEFVGGNYKLTLPPLTMTLVPSSDREFELYLTKGKVSLYQKNGLVSFATAPFNETCPTENPFMMNALEESTIYIHYLQLGERILAVPHKVVR